MSTQLIAHLKKKCEADDNVKILLSQWEFDQKLVGKALENIGGFYPHFSNHNASHSQQILVNIERILGKDIELLSGTDTWLILEAAYWHDIGMLVDAKSAKEVHGNKDFLFMVKTIAQDKGHDLHAFCAAYKENDWVAAIGSEDHPFDGVEKYRQLIAEWFRRNHDKRIGGLVEDPFKFLNITSPRTELLPKRIYRYLGQICMSHGMNFTDVIEKLPFKQTGLGTEDCHPRFIGCLLRLGDLFDLDDNRFCPVMAKHVSHQPNMSKAHEDKHLSLREFQLDRRTVKLVAECPDEMSYIETQNWFGWIREEFQNQMSQWNLIVPNPNFSSLPTIEQLDVKMEVRYEDGVKKEKILLNNKPMKFVLDEKNGMELLQGANLYNNDLSIYRELIQNAIDATMLRIWLEEDQELLKTLNPYHMDFIKILERYPLEIRLEKVKDLSNSLDSIWQLSIIDQGIGISLNDLGYMQNMAGSSRNKNRKLIINQMPIWMRPSGEFGIGLHSAFLLAKDLNKEYQGIKISTWSYFTNESIDIEMNSPLGGKQGYCFITKKNDGKKRYGTKVSVNIKCDFNLSDLNFNLYSVFDVLDKLSFESEWSNSKINDIYNEVLVNAPIVVSGFKKNTPETIWDSERQVAFFIKPALISDDDFCTEFLFKGQKIGINNWREYQLNSLPHVNYFIDIYGSNAKELLSISRDFWNVSFEEKHKEYLDFLYNKHLINETGKENDLLRLVYQEESKAISNLTGEWGGFNLAGRKINDILSLDEFFLIDNSPYFYNEDKSLCRNDIAYKVLDISLIVDPEFKGDHEILTYGLILFCKLSGYWIYNMYSYEEGESNSVYCSIKLLSKKKLENTSINENLSWVEDYDLFFSEDIRGNAFEELWKGLKEENNKVSNKIYYIEDIEGNIEVLSELCDLSFSRSDFSINTQAILSPYQVNSGEIEVLDIDDLSLYVANRRNDLSNVDKYKKLYLKLITKLDEYR